jgi:tRNA(Ile)-lysidine synthase
LKDRNQNIDFLNKLSECLHNEDIIPSRDSILIAVSGGMDSMVLLHALHTLKYKVAACHINFMLRGDESDEDQVFVKTYCDSKSITIYTIKHDITNYATERGISIQEAARIFRYAVFKEIAIDHNIHLIGTAHHWNDQIETQIQRWVEGSGWRGMLGIPFRNGNIIRPLLMFDRAEINHFATVNQIPFREDSSNSKEKYTRNYIRHQIVPKLISLNPGFLQTTKKQWVHWQESQDIYFDIIRNHWLKYAYSQYSMYFIDITTLSTKVGFRSYLYEILKLFNFTRIVTYGIADAILLKKSGTYFVNNTYECVLTKTRIVIRKLNSGALLEITLTSLKTMEATYIPNAGDFFVSEHLIESDHAFSIDLQGFPELDKITIRTWKEGDFFYPSGMDGKKKLSDWFTDQKISRLERDLYPYLVMDSRVLWIPGKRIDKSVAIQSKKGKLYIVYQKKDSEIIPLDISQQMP